MNQSYCSASISNSLLDEINIRGHFLRLLLQSFFLFLLKCLILDQCKTTQIDFNGTHHAQHPWNYWNKTVPFRDLPGKLWDGTRNINKHNQNKMLPSLLQGTEVAKRTQALVPCWEVLGPIHKRLETARFFSCPNDWWTANNPFSKCA